jgi:hypothetical protein
VINICALLYVILYENREAHEMFVGVPTAISEGWALCPADEKLVAHDNLLLLARLPRCGV